VDRSVAQGGLSARAPHAGGLDFAPATRADEPDIRRLLRDNATDGWIRLALAREPDAFAAGAVGAREHRYLVARERASGEAIGIAEWSARDAYVDGEVRLLGRLGALRIAPHYRHRVRVLRDGFAAIRDLRHPAATPYALTAIAADNAPALRLLGANLPGLPTYRPLEPFTTFALRPVRAGRIHPVEPADDADLPAIAARLARSYRELQFAPAWSTRELRERCPGLRPEDFLVVRRGPGIAGCVALWDQNAFKQTVVHGYAGALAAVRPALNLVAPLLATPRLPPAGTPLRQVYLSHLAVADDDPEIFSALMSAVLAEARRRGFGLALTGLASRHPLAAVLARRWRHRAYRSLLHVVHWDDGRRAAEALEARLPHVEIAVL
jgi:ribosomal protein S18 acetylase RimI-like enzyme